jgi:pimeloyl-ACP methyl ester carboxylesterase
MTSPFSSVVRYWLVLLGLASPHFILGQHRTLSGYLLNEQRQPVPYATVGVPGTSLGTAADEQGRFRLPIPDTLNAGAQVVVSVVGYAPANAWVRDFGPTPYQIQLVPRTVQLGEVIIRADAEQTTRLGRAHARTRLTSSLYDACNLMQAVPRREVGTVLPVSQSCRLRDFNFQVAFNTLQEVQVRLQLYRIAEGRPRQLLVPAGIPLTVAQKRGWVSVDLREFNIQLLAGQTIAATLHWEHNDTLRVERHGFVLAARSGRQQLLISRNAPDEDWQLAPGSAPVFYLTASTGTDGAASVPPAAPPAAEDAEPSPLFRLVRATHFPPHSARHYGDSTAVGRTVAVRGARLYYETYGQGEPLLLLHGQGQSIHAFHLQIAELARHFRVLAVDTRGHGRSLDETTGELTYGLLAEDVRQLLSQLQLRRVRVLGWSDGANTALHLARQAPEYVAALVLVGANLNPSPEAVDPDLLALLRQELTELPPGSPAGRWHQLQLQQPHLPPADLALLRMPTLVLAGQYDVIQESHTRAVAGAIPGAELTIFPGASHFVPHEQPRDFNARVLRFLQVTRR